jgi:hypothetical protein
MSLIGEGLIGTRWMHAVPYEEPRFFRVTGYKPEDHTYYVEADGDQQGGIVAEAAFNSDMWFRVPNPAQWDYVREKLERGRLEDLDSFNP